MKKTILLFVFSILVKCSFGGEGMWLPILLGSLQGDMQSKGFHLTAEDVYSVNHGSMKDAVVLFGGGCTGEMISAEGLLLTNHHCGLGQVQSHSSVEHDYVSTGIWAMNRNEEKPCPGLSVTFIISMEDVTDKILPYIQNISDEYRRSIVVDSLSAIIETKAITGTHYGALVRAFYYGNQFYLILTETFTDVRLVGAPPITIGNFGGETDNWMWPRHTGDFSMFRVYANTKNEPADYSTSNIPFKPRYFFPVSLKGEQENDFTMVYGFPGRTQEYISSYAVNLIQNISDPARVNYRTIKLNVWWKGMSENDTTRIKYISSYYGLANGWKKMQGEMKGLKEANTIVKKQQYELEFTNRIMAVDSLKKKYGNLLPQLKVIYDSLNIFQPLADEYGEKFLAPEIVYFVLRFRKLVGLYSVDEEQRNEKAIQYEIESMKDYVNDFFKDYSFELDKQVFNALQNNQTYGIGIHHDPAELFDHFFGNKNKVMDFLNNVSEKSVKKLKNDLGYTYAVTQNDNYVKFVQPYYVHLQNELIVLNRAYMDAQMEVFPEKIFYPDANSTLRVAYGNVMGYEPRDGVEYNWFTTLDGVIQKSHLADEDYTIPPYLLELWEKKDYGPYADKDGTLHTCFIASNHTTGGNSGSPVLDGNGNLIGTNFDRVWEGTMSDIAFDMDHCRNIIVDVRYTLWIIDKFSGAGYLLKEMKIVE